MSVRRTPGSTYRLQLHHHFGFTDAVSVLSYLDKLGVTDCYTSPLLKALPDSMHGYDITDHHVLNPDLGSPSDYQRFAETLQKRSMGHLLDFVPNHMGIDPANNPWWRDVLENGTSSPFARYFDIDWSPVKPELKNKVLLPILSDQYGVVLEQGKLQLVFENGRLILSYEEHRLPLNPRHVPDVLKFQIDALQQQMNGSAELREFQSILTELSNLPDMTQQDPAHIEERQREKEVARERLEKLVHSSPSIQSHIMNALKAFNGQVGQPESFDPLHRLLEAQAYRLAYWKTASHEINYRRFFDINQLAGLRMERPDVFEATHELLLSLIKEGKVTGLRLDHPDGLYDPAAYFQTLQAKAGPLYVVAEKILSAGESLRKSWSIDGTSGYDFLNLVNRLWIDPDHGQKLKVIYERFTGKPADSQEEIYRSKKLIMSTSMASELNVLAHLLNQISESNRRWRDFTLDSLRDALREVVACFPVYRTYISAAIPSPSDELTITKAVARARTLNPAIEASIFDFVRMMLIPQRTEGLAEEEYARRLEFAMKFQQYTAPVQAKGVEDTAFYRYNVLLSMNEVGGDLQQFGISVSDFHQANLERQRDWPGSLLATATHDTKRGEDSRARLDVLSELPQEWEHAVSEWATVNRPHKTLVGDRSCPDAHDEYLLYQALLGAWIPNLSSAEAAQLPARLRDYIIKALREAKRYTSWIRPNEEYEKAMLEFLDHLLANKRPGGFLSLFEPFAKRISRDGMVNSLAQLVLKMSSPGVPDMYQGTELWDWSLVDPDNRRPVDFQVRERLLAELESLCGAVPESEGAARCGALRQLVLKWEDGRIKMLITTLALRYRKSHPELFSQGSYIPLHVVGDKADHVVAFAREQGSERLLVMVPRLVAHFTLKTRLWGATRVQIPEAWGAVALKNIFTAEQLKTTGGKGALEISLSDVFATLPVAWLTAL